jgi:hypothetical protein
MNLKMLAIGFDHDFDKRNSNAEIEKILRSAVSLSIQNTSFLISPIGQETEIMAIQVRPILITTGKMEPWMI